MNRIHNAFNNITVNDELKEKTYQKIIINNKPTNHKKINFFHLSLAMTSIIVCIFIYSINNHKNNDLNSQPEVNILNAVDASLNENNYIIYNNTKYILDNSIIIEENMLDKKIGNTNQAFDSNMESDFQNNASIYSIKNIDKTLQIAVLTNNKILVFVVEK